MHDTISGDARGTPTQSSPTGAMAEKRFYPVPLPDPLDRSTHGLRQLLGALGVLLPPLCWIWASILPSSQNTLSFLARLSPPNALSSVSAYYYTSAVWAFVGILVAMGLFLFTYRGFQDRRQVWDYWVSNFAGAMAITVAVFPTKTPEGFERLAWWHSPMGTIHLAAASLLFLSFIVFCWFLFPTKDKRVSEQERVRLGYTRYTFRDRVKHYPAYYGSGLGIAVCLVWALVETRAGHSIFLPEWLALWFFGVSWLRKGQVLWSLRQLRHRFSRTRAEGADVRS